MKASEIIRKYDIKAIKKLDQHFLVDNNIVKKEVEFAEIKKDERILEIGAGFGLLTQEILNKSKNVVVIEKDRKLIGVLKKEFSSLDILEGDALKIEFPSFDKCVSNIPYSISSGIIYKLGKLGKPSILLLQKEFAQRLIAQPNERNYSRLSIMAQYYFSPVLLKEVSKNSFFPTPKVDSMIVKLVPKHLKPEVNEEFFFLVVRALFNHKNQKVRKALLHSRNDFGADKERIKKMSISYEDRKVISLNMNELMELSKELNKYINV